MNQTRLVVIGGFLGAGKTTALVRLAQSYHAQGKRVGLITNDQAANLVDTGTVRVRGFRVEEVAGACFCCKFDELAQAAERMRIEARPDVLLGEPVGSCTDLAATVVAPFRKIYADRYDVAPYSVLVDPTRARQIVIDQGFGGFSPKVAYIFQKQLEEADIIGLNKVDLLGASERDLLLRALTQEFPRARVLGVSSLTGEGFDAWRTLLAQPTTAGRNITDVDYDTYAEGEAELGWLNLTMAIDSHEAFAADRLVRDLLEAMRLELQRRRAEVAHLKVMFETDGRIAIANDVGAHRPVQLSQPMNAQVRRGQLTLNARVHVDPIDLRAIADRSLASVLREHRAVGTVQESTQFRPGRPVPTHRYASPEGGASR